MRLSEEAATGGGRRRLQACSCHAGGAPRLGPLRNVRSTCRAPRCYDDLRFLCHAHPFFCLNASPRRRLSSLSTALISCWEGVHTFLSCELNFFRCARECGGSGVLKDTMTEARDAMSTAAAQAPVTMEKRIRTDLEEHLPKPC